MSDLSIDLGSYSIKCLLEDEEPIELFFIGEQDDPKIVCSDLFFDSDETDFNSILKIEKKTDKRKVMVNGVEEERDVVLGVVKELVNKQALAKIVGYCMDNYNLNPSSTNIIFSKPYSASQATDEMVESVCADYGINKHYVITDRRLLFTCAYSIYRMPKGIVVDGGSDSIRLGLFDNINDKDIVDFEKNLEDQLKDLSVKDKSKTKDGVITETVFQMGGDYINEMLVEGLAVSRKQAEFIKRGHFSIPKCNAPVVDVKNIITTAYYQLLGSSIHDFRQQETFYTWFAETFAKLRRDQANFKNLAEDSYVYNVLVCGGLSESVLFRNLFKEIDALIRDGVIPENVSFNGRVLDVKYGSKYSTVEGGVEMLRLAREFGKKD